MYESYHNPTIQFPIQSYHKVLWMETELQLTCMLPNACRNTFVYVLWKKNKTFVILLRSPSYSKWIWIVSLLGFIPLWCNDAGNLLWYFALKSILGVFLPLIFYHFSFCRCWLCIFSQSFSSWHMLYRPTLKRYFSFRKLFNDFYL